MFIRYFLIVSQNLLPLISSSLKTSYAITFLLFLFSFLLYSLLQSVFIQNQSQQRIKYQMSVSDRASKKNNDLPDVSYFSDRGSLHTENRNLHSKIKLTNEEVQSIKSSKKSNSSRDKERKKSIFSNIVHFIVPEVIFDQKTCPICEDSYILSQIRQFGSCKHFFCESCLKQYVKFKLDSFQLFLCPFGECKVLLEKNTLLYDEILTQQDKIKYAKIQRHFLILSNPGLQSCKNQNCSGIINFTQEKGLINSQITIKCSECQLQYCPECKDQKHQGKCEKYMIKFLEKNKKFRQCKKCNRVIEKSQGCTHMTCLCGHLFCYMCGEELQAGPHECFVPPDLNCLQKVRWDIEHRQLFYESNFFSFHRCLYFIDFSGQNHAIFRVLFSILYTMSVYPITIFVSILLTILFLVLLTVFLFLVFLFLPLSELCNNQDYCFTQTIANSCGIYGLAILTILFYPVFVFVIMIEAIIYFVDQDNGCEQISRIFFEIGLGLRNVLMIPIVLCILEQANQTQQIS